MKKYQYHFKLTWIVPFIFGGLALISSLVSSYITRHYDHDPDTLALYINLWSVLITLFSLSCGLAVVRFMLRPLREFVEKTKEIPFVTDYDDVREDKPGTSEVDRYTGMLRHVTTVLNRIDSRQLFPEIIGESRSIRSVLGQVVKVAPLDSTVLIIGESGTGKELVADSLHYHSNRKLNPMVKLNCAAIAETLLESELFGYEKGAFTGANQTRKGRFEAANSGTLFLDEIGDMPLNTQAKILRVLQERELERVGGSRTIKVDVRFIAATNKNLDQMVAEGRFREDLLFRLNNFTVSLPPLRERTEDIPLLVKYFLESAPRHPRFSPSAMQALATYAWPGNIRELKNFVEMIAVMIDEDVIEPEHLPMNLFMREGTKERNGVLLCDDLSLDGHLQEVEKRLIVEALRMTDGVQVKAAELLGINQRSLWHRVRKYEIDVDKIKK